MNEEAKKLCEELDAAIFSSDTFFDLSDQEGLAEYIARWTRFLNE